MCKQQTSYNVNSHSIEDVAKESKPSHVYTDNRELIVEGRGMWYHLIVRLSSPGSPVDCPQWVVALPGCC